VKKKKKSLFDRGKRRRGGGGGMIEGRIGECTGEENTKKESE